MLACQNDEEWKILVNFTEQLEAVGKHENAKSKEWLNFGSFRHKNKMD